jgi:predicted Ser/Thr protein kinase
MKALQAANYTLKPVQSFRVALTRHGYSEKTIREICKWYGFSDKRRDANF